jgi:hypothetical protein
MEARRSSETKPAAQYRRAMELRFAGFLRYRFKKRLVAMALVFTDKHSEKNHLLVY